MQLRILTPWRLLGRHGTIAADTAVFPMGTEMLVPGYGWGRVEDRGGAIQGKRLDLFHGSHKSALQWGRKTVKVCVIEVTWRQMTKLQNSNYVCRKFDTLTSATTGCFLDVVGHCRMPDKRWVQHRSRSLPGGHVIAECCCR